VTEYNPNSRFRPAPGKKEFAKALKKINKMLEAGKSRKDIHTHLTEAGRLNISYPRFCVLLVEEQTNNAPPPRTERAVKKTAPAHPSPQANNSQIARSRKRPPNR